MIKNHHGSRPQSDAEPLERRPPFMADEQVLFSPALDEDVLVKAKDEISRFHELQQRALEGHSMPEAVNQGCDITLSHMSLSTLPPELIDIVKNEVSRLALDHNRLHGLSGLSLRFSECSRLRYLVMRNNQLREFPPAILSVPTLELLDLKGNKIESLPEDLSKLRKLRVFSIHHNRISRIPSCVGQMNSLVHFTTTRNPISFPPMEEWMTTDMESQKNDKMAEDAKIRTETKNLKNWLMEYGNRGRLRPDGDNEMSEENVETPRPARRKTSGRFPIKPSHSGSDLKELSIASPTSTSSLPLKPPPIPSKSFARLPTQPQTATFQPDPSPIATLSDRHRSNSESQMSTALRTKRMGIIPRKPIAPNSVDLDQAKRLSHLRGLSHGSALHDGAPVSTVTDSSSPASPIDVDPQRVAFVRRLSSLPEGKRKSHTEDPLVDVARGVLYALDQIHAPIKKLLRVLKDGRRSQLERTCQVAFSFTEELDRRLTKLASQDEENEADERQKSSMAIRTSCEACIRAFEQLILALQQEVRTLVVFSNPLYIRTLMHLLYASLVELRNACTKLGAESQATPRPPQRATSRGRFLSPAPGRPLTSMKVREHTPLLPHSRSSSRRGPRLTPPNNAPLTVGSRNGSMINLANATTRPTEAYTPVGNVPSPIPTTRMSRSDTVLSREELDDELKFEDIFVKLSQALELILKVLPRCHVIITETGRMAAEKGANEADLLTYAGVCDRCRVTIEAADALKRRMGTLKIREPAVREHLEYWHLCTAFIRAYTMFAARLKECWQASTSLIPDEVKQALKPVQRSTKEISKLINNSPWSQLAATPGQQPSASALLAQSKSRSNTLTNGQSIPMTQIPHSRSQVNTAQRQQAHPKLSLSTRGAPPPSALDPLSAASTHSMSGLGIASGYVTPVATGPNTSFSGSNTSFPGPNAGGSGSGGVMSGYVTPLAATPMSAALGPAAGVTVPLPISLQLAALAVGNGGPSVLAGGNSSGVGTLNNNIGLAGSAMPLGGLLSPAISTISETNHSNVNHAGGNGVNFGIGLLSPSIPSSFSPNGTDAGYAAGGMSSTAGLSPSLMASMNNSGMGTGLGNGNNGFPGLSGGNIGIIANIGSTGVGGIVNGANAINGVSGPSSTMLAAGVGAGGGGNAMTNGGTTSNITDTVRNISQQRW